MNVRRVFVLMLLDGRINGSCCCKWFANPTLGNLGNFGNLKSEMFSFWDNAVKSCDYRRREAEWHGKMNMHRAERPNDAEAV